MGVAGYSEMAHMLGLYDVAEKYAGIAKKMAVKWEEMANEGDHYRLAFDRENTWSQKYNMIWDKMWKKWQMKVIITALLSTVRIPGVRNII